MKNIKTELYNDHFQNYKVYGIPKQKRRQTTLARRTRENGLKGSKEIQRQGMVYYHKSGTGIRQCENQRRKPPGWAGRTAVNPAGCRNVYPVLLRRLRSAGWIN